MALPTPVNSQITDSVTQANVKVLADAPAMALGNLYQMVSTSLGLAAQNAVSAQQQSNIIHQATTTHATEKVSRADIPADLANVLGVVKALGNQQPRVTG